jgi:hypothetical protein
MRKGISTHLVRREAKTDIVCTFCKNKIKPGEEYYLEEGIKEHLHSLLARKYCYECYSKHGEKLLTLSE